MGLNSGSSSSEEIGDQSDDQKVINENAVPASRFYECTYCKRGFTNAQALGGHMNIHRKEKAQAKLQNSANKRQSSKSYEDLANCGTSTTSHPRYYEHDQQQTQNYEVPVRDQQMIDNYSYQQHYYFPAPRPNPRYGSQYDGVAPGNENPYLLDQDHVDLGHVNRDGTNNTCPESEVDLELRLGLTL